MVTSGSDIWAVVDGSIGQIFIKLFFYRENIIEPCLVEWIIG